MADYYSSGNSNDFYTNPYGQSMNSQYQHQHQHQQQNHQQSQPHPTSSSNFNNNGQNPTPSLWNPTTISTAAQLATTAAAFANPNNNNNNNEAIYKMGLQMGHTFLDQGTAKLIPGLETFMKTLRVYFAVDNGYVKRKMWRVLFSFFCKNWTRAISSASSSMDTKSSSFSTSNTNDPNNMNNNANMTNNNDVTTYALPIHDDNAPDLYIPFMSLITYVLLCALCYGTAGQFDPEVILNVTTKCMIIQILEVCLFKFGIYMMNGGDGGISSTMSFLDLLAFTGYKYLGLTCNMLIGLTITLMRLGSGITKSSSFGAKGMDGGEADLVSSVVGDGGDDDDAAAAAASNIVATTTDSSGYGGQRGYYIMFLWTASSICYFMLKTMANNVPYTYQQQQGISNGPKRELVILGFALSQFFTLWFLGQTKFLN